MDLFGGLALLWQVATRAWDRSRVQVELLTALGECDLSPRRRSWPSLAFSTTTGFFERISSGKAIPVIVVRVRARGPVPITVEGIALTTPSGQMLRVTPAEHLAPPLPHRLEGGSSGAWPVDYFQLLSWFAHPTRRGSKGVFAR